MKKTILVALLLLAFSQAYSQCYTITRFAGNDGYCCDGSPATSASLNTPKDIAIDASGNIYVAEYYNNIVRKISTSGIITTVAGTGTAGYSGDGAAATAANLYYPSSVAIDLSGNVIICDRQNNRIRKVNSAGIITTIAGNGTSGFSGDGGPATAAQLSLPYGIALDNSDNIYVADFENNRIRKISSGGLISTIAGNGTSAYGGDGGPATNASLQYPSAVLVNPVGNIYIADQYNYRVRVVNTSGIITTMAGNGTTSSSGSSPSATSTCISPDGLAMDASGNIYVSDLLNNSIRKINSAGIISNIAGNGMSSAMGGDGGAATAAALFNPAGLKIDNSGNVYIADYGNNRIRKVNSSGTISTFAGGFNIGDGGTAINAGLSSWTTGVATDRNGNVYIADKEYFTIKKVSPGGMISIVAGTGDRGYGADGIMATASQISDLLALACDPAGNLYFVDGARIRKISTSGMVATIAGGLLSGFSGDGGPATLARLNFPYGVTIDRNGNIFIADLSNNRVRKINTSGIITTVAGNGTAGFSGDGGMASAAMLNQPVSVAIDSADNLYIADRFNSRIRKINAAGTISTIAGNGSSVYSGDGVPATNTGLEPFYGIASDSSGNVFIPAGYRILKINPTGTITTVAGNTLDGYSGDGGPATSAFLRSQYNLAVDPSGNIYTTTQSKNFEGVVRKLSPHVIFDPIYGPSAMCTGESITLTVSTPSGTWSSSNNAIATVNGSGIVQGVTEGNVIITYTVSNICGTNSDTQAVIINPQPNAGTITGVNALCFSSTATLGNSSTGGTWTSSVPSVATISSGLITAIAAGTTIISYSVSNSCGTAIDTQSVTVIALPDAGTIIGENFACLSSTTSLFDISTGGVWSSSIPSVATVGAGLVTAVAIGTTIISYSVSNSCGTAIDTQSITVIAPPNAGTIIGGNSTCLSSISPLSDISAGGVWSSSIPSVATVNSGLVTAVAAGTTIISYSVSNSCGIAIDTQSITIIPFPDAGTITGSNSVCLLSTTTLSNSTAAGTWTSSDPSVATVNNGIITSLGIGTAIISYSISNECGTAVDTQLITVNPLPDAGIISGVDTVNELGTIMLTSTITGGTWSSGDTSVAVVNNGLVTGISSGSVLITYSVTNECGTSIDTILVTVIPPLAVSQITKGIFSVSLFPNPSKGLCYIKTSYRGAIKKGILYITDLTGRQLMQQTIDINTTATINLNYPSGTYFVTVLVGGNHQTIPLSIVN